MTTLTRIIPAVLGGIALSATMAAPAFAYYNTNYGYVPQTGYGAPECNRFDPHCMSEQWNYAISGLGYPQNNAYYYQPSYPSYNYSNYSYPNYYGYNNYQQPHYDYAPPTYQYPSYGYQYQYQYQYSYQY